MFGIPVTRDAQRRLLEQVPALQRRINSISRVWGEAVNGLEAGWVPDADTHDAILWVGTWLREADALDQQAREIIRAAVARAIATGRLRASDLPANSGLAALPLIITGAIALAIVGLIPISAWTALAAFREYVNNPEAVAKAALIAQGRNIPFDPNAGASARALAPWMFAAAVIAAAFAFKPWRR